MPTPPSPIPLPPRAKDIEGRTSGKLTARYPVGKNGNGHVMWFCECECGGSKVTPAGCIISTFTTSCGCENAEKSRRSAAAWKDQCRPPTFSVGGLHFDRDDSIDGYRSECGNYEVRKEASRWVVFGVSGGKSYEFSRSSDILKSLDRAANIERAMRLASVRDRTPVFALLEGAA